MQALNSWISPKPSQVRSVLLVALISCSGALAAGACVPYTLGRTADRTAVTEVRIGALREAIELAEAYDGRLPASLDSICWIPQEGECRRGLQSARLRREDGWGTPMLYVRRSEEYQIHSAGPDRQFGTGDDHVFDRAQERVHLRVLQGCYVLATGVEALDALVLTLLGTATTIPGRFSADGRIPGYWEPGWRIQPDGTAVVEWREPHSTIVLRLNAVDERTRALVGTVHVPGQPARPIRADARACDAQT